MGKLNNLHEELVIGILLRLPVDSLMRFKCVHKSWYDLIKSPQFLTIRSTYADNDSGNLCILVKNWNTNARRIGEKVTTLSLVTSDKVHHETLYGNKVSFYVKDVDLPLVSEYPNIFVTANSHGMACLYSIYCEYTAIVNPGIGESTSIPAESCIPLPLVYDFEECNHRVCRVGSGFDLKNNDFKIVRIIHIMLSSGTPIGYPQAELYTLSSNSWRQIDFISYCDITPTFAYNYLERYWNGVYYWPFEANYYQEHHGGRGILSFDMSDEVFQFRILPEWIFEFDDDDSLETMVYFGILEYNGALALVSYLRNISYPQKDMEKCFYIWALDEFWVNGALTKLLSIGPLLRVEQPLGFLNCDQLLLQLSDGKVQSYNILTKERKNLPIHCQWLFDQVVFYKPSLVSIHGGGNN